MLVIPGLVPGTHPSAARRGVQIALRDLPLGVSVAEAWIPSTRPGMTFIIGVGGVYSGTSSVLSFQVSRVISWRRWKAAMAAVSGLRDASQTPWSL
jgi:hypothetical protein